MFISIIYTYEVDSKESIGELCIKGDSMSMIWRHVYLWKIDITLHQSNSGWIVCTMLAMGSRLIKRALLIINRSQCSHHNFFYF